MLFRVLTMLKRVISNAPKKVWVGSSSRKLPLSQSLNLGGPGGYGS